MKVNFKRKNEFDDYSSIATFFSNNNISRVQSYISNNLNFDLSYLCNLDFDMKIDYIYKKLHKEYLEVSPIIDNKIIEVNTLWNLVCDDIFSILSKEFDLILTSNRVISAEFTLNVVCPRDIDRWSFDINYRKSNDDIILVCIHEIIHFIWFEKWKYIFPDNNDFNFDTPSLSWLFSEIAIDAIMKESDLNKYCCVDKPAYKHFYNTYIDEVEIMEFFRQLYKDNSMDEFMSKGYEFIVENENFFSKLI